MIAPFEASRLKIIRARKHTADLKIEIANYFLRKPCVIVVETYFSGAVPGANSFVSRIKEQVPPSLAPIIGDAIHNLRTALDLLACDLVRLAGKSARHVYFPFCSSPEELRYAIKKRHLNKAGSDVVAVIESLQPYTGGNLILRALHDMDIADKHQALLIAVAAVTIPLGDILKVPQDFPFGARVWNTLIADGHMVIGLPQNLSPPLGTELPSTFFLCFSEGDGFIKGRQVLEFLHQAADLVDGIVDTLAGLRPGAVFPTTS